MTEQGTGARRSLASRLRGIGPALLLAAVVIGPGSITLATIAGSLYGYNLVWVPVVATVFMMLYSAMSARVGLVTGQTLFGAVRHKYGAAVATVAGVLGFLTILAFQAGNNAGIGFASQALFGGDVRVWAVVFTAISIGFVWLPELYTKVEWLVRIVVGLMLIAFVGTLIVAGFDVGAAAGGLVPSVPDVDGFFLSLGIAATTFSIAAAAYQSHLMREKQWGVDRLADARTDIVLGIGVLGLISVAIMLTSASVLHGGEPVFTADGMAVQLEPIAGPVAFYLFTFGFFFASLSSLVVNALIGAALLVDGRGGSASMRARPVRLWATLAMVIGLVIVLPFGNSPIGVLRAAQALAIVAFPLLAFLIVGVAGDRRIMGEHRNKPWVSVLAALGYMLILGIVINYVRELVRSP